MREGERAGVGVGGHEVREWGAGGSEREWEGEVREWEGVGVGGFYARAQRTGRNRGGQGDRGPVGGKGRVGREIDAPSRATQTRPSPTALVEFAWALMRLVGLSRRLCGIPTRHPTPPHPTPPTPTCGLHDRGQAVGQPGLAVLLPLLLPDGVGRVVIALYLNQPPALNVLACSARQGGGGRGPGEGGSRSGQQGPQGPCRLRKSGGGGGFPVPPPLPNPLPSAPHCLKTTGSPRQASGHMYLPR